MSHITNTEHELGHLLHHTSHLDSYLILIILLRLSIIPLNAVKCTEQTIVCNHLNCFVIFFISSKHTKMFYRF